MWKKEREYLRDHNHSALLSKDGEVNILGSPLFPAFLTELIKSIMINASILK